MRKIVAGLFVSLDGVVETPEHWGFRYFSGELTGVINEGIARSDAVLLGRRTYLEFARIWPSQPAEVPMSVFLNQSHKYVVTSRLDRLEWGPASRLTGDLASEIGQLKRGPGKNIQIPGSPTLVRSLLRDGLLDEITLSICPIVVGPGMRLFEGIDELLPLQVVGQARSFDNGVINVTYARAVPDDLPSEPGPAFPAGSVNEEAS